MNSNGSKEIKRALEQTFNLSDLTGCRAYLRGKRIGKLEDLAIIDLDKYAEVTHVCIERPFGQTTIYAPWNTVRSLSGKELILDVENIESFAGDPPAGFILLKDQVLDKRVLDVEGRELEVVLEPESFQRLDLRKECGSV